MKTRKVLNITKNKDIPSIPKKKWILNKETQLKCSINWNFEVEQSKKSQRNKESKNVREENKKAICFITISFSSGTVSKQITPTRGKIISDESILINYIWLIV